MTQVDTRLVPFSNGYQLTKFDLEVYDGDTVQISRGRYEDIEYWWSGRDVPLVLKLSNRRYTPEASQDVDYDVLRLPEYMMPSDWGFPPDVVTTLVPSEDETELLMGF